MALCKSAWRCHFLSPCALALQQARDISHISRKNMWNCQGCMINHNPVYQEEGLHYSHKLSPDQETKVTVCSCSMSTCKRCTQRGVEDWKQATSRAVRSFWKQPGQKCLWESTAHSTKISPNEAARTRHITAAWEYFCLWHKQFATPTLPVIDVYTFINVFTQYSTVYTTDGAILPHSPVSDNS